MNLILAFNTGRSKEGNVLHMNLRKRYRKYITYTGTAGMLALSVALTGCSKEASGPGDGNATPSEVTEIQAVPETIAQLGLQGQVLPGLNDVDLPDAEPAPEYLRIGVRHEIVKKLQQRLMDLGFMDNDEPTDYFGEMTQMAVKHFQRQNELPMDGIVGNATWDAIMAEDAKYYAVSKGTQGDDIQRIQQQLSFWHHKLYRSVNTLFHNTLSLMVINKKKSCSRFLIYPGRRPQGMHILRRFRLLFRKKGVASRQHFPEVLQKQVQPAKPAIAFLHLS